MDIASAKKLHENGSGLRLFQGIRPVSRAGAMRDALAGFTLAAMNVPQALGYTKIAGTPVVTGLYTLLLPLVAFATFGSSRYLVVAADSATAAILAGGLSHMAPVASAHYVALAGLVALLTRGLPAAGAAIQARLPRRLPLADGARRVSHRRRIPGRYRGARRDAGCAGRQPQDGRATRPGGPRLAAGACADDLPLGGGRGGRPLLPRARTAAARPALRRRRRSGGECRVRLLRATESPSSGRWQEACRGSEYRM